MIGDPKQAIKYPKAFDTFVDKVSAKEYVNILEINNQTIRVPKEILAISNGFCYEGQQQESLSDVVGELMYIESTDAKYDDLLSSYISTKQIVCIDKKVGRYSTSSKHKHSFPHEIEQMIRESKHKKDKVLFAKAAFFDFFNDVEKYGAKIAINNLRTMHSLTFEAEHYAQLYELCSVFTENNVQFIVQSIDSVKGLDANTCVIITSPNLLKYLTKNGIKEDDYFNKEWKKVYVALTRAKHRLVLALDHDLLLASDIEAVRSSISELGFVYHL